MGQTNQIAKYPIAPLVQLSSGLVSENQDLEDINYQIEIAAQSGDNESIAELQIEKSAKIDKIYNLLDPLLHACEPFGLFRDLEEVVAELEMVKNSVSLESSVYADLKDQLVDAQASVELAPLVDKRDKSFVSYACALGQDFNTTRSNKDKR